MNFQVRVGVEPLGRLPRPAPPDGGHHAKVRHSEKFQTWPRPAEAAAAPANTRYGLRQQPGLPGPRFPRLRNGATASSHPCGPCKLWGAVLPLWAWLVSLQGPSLRAASPPLVAPLHGSRDLARHRGVSPWLGGAAGGCRHCSADWLSPLGLRLPVLVKGLLGPGCRAGPAWRPPSRHRKPGGGLGPMIADMGVSLVSGPPPSPQCGRVCSARCPSQLLILEPRRGSRWSSGWVQA